MINLLYASWFSLLISAKGRFRMVETPETLFYYLLKNYSVYVCPFRRHTLSINNRVMLVLMWFRCYNTYHRFSTRFNISVLTVKEESRTLPILYLKLNSFIIWPYIVQWQRMSYSWEKICAAVGAIDGTSHELFVYSNTFRYVC